MDLRSGAIVVSTLRNGTFLFPDAEQRLEAGDVVTVLARATDVGSVQATMGFQPEPAS